MEKLLQKSAVALIRFQIVN